MSKQNSVDPSVKIGDSPDEKLAYEAPQITFLPLKTEEKLLACTRFTRSACGSGPYFNS